MPFLLLPFRPTSDPSAARTFIRNFFNASVDKGTSLEGEGLNQELRLTEPMVRSCITLQGFSLIYEVGYLQRNEMVLE